MKNVTNKKKKESSKRSHRSRRTKSRGCPQKGCIDFSVDFGEKCGEAPAESNWNWRKGFELVREKDLKGTKNNTAKEGRLSGRRPPSGGNLVDPWDYERKRGGGQRSEWEGKRGSED